MLTIVIGFQNCQRGFSPSLFRSPSSALNSNGTDSGPVTNCGSGFTLQNGTCLPGNFSGRIMAPGAVDFSTVPGAVPFSFTYGGVPFNASNWSYSSQGPNSWVYTDPTSTLQVTVLMQAYGDYNAAKWSLFFQNISATANSAVIAGVNVADLQLVSAIQATQNYTVSYSVGALGDNPSSDGSTSMPTVSDFTPIQNRPPPNSSLPLSPSYGRSSSGVMPYFNVSAPNGTSGIIFAVGWSGQWASLFQADATGTTLGFKAGQQNFSLQLRPGESVRSPSILMMPWSGQDYIVGQNEFRSMMLKHFSPTQANGKALAPISSASLSGYNDATTILPAIAAIAASGLSVNTIWNDAGWYPMTNNLWYTGVGDWLPDATRYPGGYAPISAAAHSAGMRSLLWFEPERVAMPAAAYSTYLNNHWLFSFPPVDASRFDPNYFMMVNFSDGNIVNSMGALIANRISTFGIDVLRMDMNNLSLPNWTLNDQNQTTALGGLQRSGATEAGYVAGLYQFWDSLRTQFPELIIDNCAAGGRRLDFEALSRTVPLWRSDRVWAPEDQQEQMLGLSMWVPLQGRGSDSSMPAEGTVDSITNLTGSAYLQYKIRSGYGWTGVFNFPWNSLASDVQKLLVNETGYLFGTKSPSGTPLAELFKGDFYPMPLVQNQVSNIFSGAMPNYMSNYSVWLGWSFFRADLKMGLIQGFRRSPSAPSSTNFVLRGILASSSYKITDLDTGSSQVIAGSVLVATGFPMSCPNSACAKIFVFEDATIAP